MAKGKERLDKLLVARELVTTRSKAQAHILAGEGAYGQTGNGRSDQC